MKLKIIKINPLHSIGLFSVIIVALNFLYYRKKDELIYFKFDNLLYSNKLNIWDKFFIQPFNEYQDIIEKKLYQKDYKVEYFNNYNKNFPLNWVGKNIKLFYQKELINKFRKIFQEKIIFNNKIINKAKIFEAKYLNNKTLSIHIRGTDKFHAIDGHHKNLRNELDFSNIEKTIKLKMNQYKIKKLFLASDDKEYVKLIKNKFKTELTKMNSTIFSEKKGVHTENVYQNEDCKTKLGVEAILDSILISKCFYSLLSQSNLSLVSILLRKDYKYKLIDENLKSR
jgi:hypothetical protein